MKIIWSDDSIQDLAEIFEFLAVKSISAAERLIDDIDLRVLQLTDFPYSGPKQYFRKKRRKEYRYLVEGNCKIFYSVGKDIVIIEAVFNTRQDPSKLRL